MRHHQSKGYRRVMLIYTGGTIGMIKNPHTGALDTFNFDHLMKHVPELAEFDYQLTSYAFNPPIDSSDMHPLLWAKLADIIAEYYDRTDGFVILHGTDTMAYTASALSFMLKNLQKPVVLTGSQLPIGVLRTDGKENLINAIELAAAVDSDGNPKVQEVCVCFGQQLLRGNRVTKCSAENFSAFKSYNCQPLAVTGVNIAFNDKILLRPTAGGVFTTHTQMDSSVIAITLFPGISRKVIEHVFSYKDIKGVVLRTFGSGNAPRLPWLTDAIRKATEEGKVVVNITQCQMGAVHMGLYETGNQLRLAGVVSGHDMTVECAVTKLMYLFGQGYPQEEVMRLMDIPIAGELTAEDDTNIL